MPEGKDLQEEYEDTVKEIDKHTEEGTYDGHWPGTRHYCECPKCHENRQKLSQLSDEMRKIGYTRKAMF